MPNNRIVFIAVEFMTLFYKNLFINQNTDEASLNTQNSIRQQYDAYIWAAFSLIK